ncbi:hypothetical protein CRM22_007670 [Opisthorchis felineus]|uniref:Uncharacterized protein n=1 Tax=Opisthorchis felineus TaxID=147828 RepID=A0A4S2LF76_OPIFE|nr:hypothetical protein CRM22_007670 [Opisthorchis felineus]TGZ62010.1 hypothetical protein CRM22_007670 [Opisthorchis felineus]TGZ62011.1 hypothetical protein CRM22_007670 [Opisthorchis felineus]
MLYYEILCWSAAMIVSWKVVYPFLRMLFMFTIAKKLYSKRKQLRNAGEWAIVTGAAAGIGQAYARELAKDGLNIMLIDIDEAGLSSMATELEDNFSVKTITFICDFTRADIYKFLEAEIDRLPSIACLVNNVGISYSRLARFDNAEFIDFEFIRNLINCNMHSMIGLTRIVLPRLLKQNKPGSAIINLSSFTGIIPYPYLSLYGASKAFIQHFVKSLIPETKDSNVTIQALCPLVVATKLARDWRPSFFVPTPDEYVRSAIDMLGVEEVTTGYFPHALKAFVVTLFPILAIYQAEGAYKKMNHIKDH